MEESRAFLKLCISKVPIGEQGPSYHNKKSTRSPRFVYQDLLWYDVGLQSHVTA